MMIQTHGAHALMYFYSWMEIALFKKRKKIHCPLFEPSSQFWRFHLPNFGFSAHSYSWIAEPWCCLAWWDEASPALNCKPWGEGAETPEDSWWWQVAAAALLPAGVHSISRNTGQGAGRALQWRGTGWSSMLLLPPHGFLLGLRIKGT